MAAPQGPCPLPGGARLTGIESRDDAPPRRMVMLPFARVEHGLPLRQRMLSLVPKQKYTSRKAVSA